jgi:hypothetical protein
MMRLDPLRFLIAFASAAFASVMAGWDARPWNEKIFDRLF